MSGEREKIPELIRTTEPQPRKITPEFVAQLEKAGVGFGLVDRARELMDADTAVDDAKESRPI